MEENKVETIEVTEVNETEDVKEGLSATEYGVILGLMGAGIAAWEGGKLVWRKTEKPRSKVKNFVTGIFKKDNGNEAAEETPEHEVAQKEATKKADSKKSDKSEK